MKYMNFMNFVSDLDFLKTKITNLNMYLIPNIDNFVPNGYICDLKILVHMDDLTLKDLTYIKKLSLSIHIDIQDRMHKKDLGLIHMDLAGGAILPYNFSSADEEKVDQYLSTNIIGMLYSTGRTHLETITSMTSLGRYTLPAIDVLDCLEYYKNNKNVDKDVNNE